MGKWLSAPSPGILITIRNDRFHGEGDREIGFRSRMTRLFDQPRFHVVVEGGANSRPIGPLAREALSASPEISAIYSIGGSNGQILEALQSLDRDVEAFIAHHLDSENCRFLRMGRIDAVLDHDFRQDVATSCRLFMAHHKLAFESEPPLTSQIRLVLPTMLPDYAGPFPQRTGQ